MKENETLADIVAEIRKDKKPYSAKVAEKLDEQTVGDRVLMQEAAECLRDDEHYIKSLADRIKAAWEREKAEIEASALSVGGMVEASRQKPDPNWAEICAKCHDGEIEPDCEYYGEPNGCNSPIYGQHPKTAPSGNAAAMREVLEKLQARFQRNTEAYYDRYLKYTGWHWTKKAAEAKKWCDIFSELNEQCRAVLATPPHEAVWEAGGEYEFAYCSSCGHMQFADWDSHVEQAENIGDFHKKYKFCPNCGAKMKGDDDGSK